MLAWLNGTRWARISSIVLFPAPDAPMIATISEGLMLNVIGWIRVFDTFSCRAIREHTYHAACKGVLGAVCSDKHKAARGYAVKVDPGHAGWCLAFFV